MIDAKDKEEAIAIAKLVPGARIGTVEVRPLIEITGLPTINVGDGRSSIHVSVIFIIGGSQR